METNSSLQMHYNKKYASTDIPLKIAFAKFPKNRNQAIVKYISKGNIYLEIGAGNGNVLLTVEKDFNKLIGIELSEPRVNMMKAFFAQNPNIQITKANIEHDELPIEANSIDIIVMDAVIEHLIDPYSVLKKLHKYLKPQGEIIITTPNMAKWTRRIKLLFGYFPSTASLNEGLTTYYGHPTDLYDEGHLHYFTYRSLSIVLKNQAGFSEIKRGYYGKYPLLCRLAPTLFSDILLIAKK